MYIRRNKTLKEEIENIIGDWLCQQELLIPDKECDILTKRLMNYIKCNKCTVKSEHSRKVNKRHILLVITQTQFQDYDILAIGDLTLLKQMAQKDKSFQLIKSSKYGGIPILILDTTDTLTQANRCIKEYREMYGL